MGGRVIIVRNPARPTIPIVRATATALSPVFRPPPSGGWNGNRPGNGGKPGNGGNNGWTGNKPGNGETTVGPVINPATVATMAGPATNPGNGGTGNKPGNGGNNGWTGNKPGSGSNHKPATTHPATKPTPRPTPKPTIKPAPVGQAGAGDWFPAFARKHQTSADKTGSVPSIFQSGRRETRVEAEVATRAVAVGGNKGGGGGQKHR